MKPQFFNILLICLTSIDPNYFSAEGKTKVFSKLNILELILVYLYCAQL